MASKTISVRPYSFKKEFIKTVYNILGLPDYMLKLVEYGIRYAIEAGAEGVLWVIDEPQYLEHMRAFLESLIKKILV